MLLSLRNVIIIGFIIIIIILLIEFIIGWYSISHLLFHGEIPTRHADACGCSMENCFNICSGKQLKVYIYEPLTGFHELKKKILSIGLSEMSDPYIQYLDGIRKSEFYTKNADDACLFVPPFDTSCDKNRCYPGENLMSEMLHSLKYWNHGRNHLIFEKSDNIYLPYEAEKAIVMRTSSSSLYFRYHYDISLGLTSKKAREFALESIIPTSTRKYNISFIGSISSNRYFRKKLLPLHDGEKRIICLKCSGYINDRLCSEILDRCKNIPNDYDHIIRQSKFSIAIKGVGLHSFRLTESMAIGSIPIIIADNYVLPFEELLPWHKFSIKVLENEIDKIPDIISRISDQQANRMQILARCIFLQYLLNYEVQAVNALHLLQRRKNRLEGNLVNDSYWQKCEF